MVKVKKSKGVVAVWEPEELCDFEEPPEYELIKYAAWIRQVDTGRGHVVVYPSNEIPVFS